MSAKDVLHQSEAFLHQIELFFFYSPPPLSPSLLLFLTLCPSFPRLFSQTKQIIFFNIHIESNNVYHKIFHIFSMIKTFKLATDIVRSFFILHLPPRLFLLPLLFFLHMIVSEFLFSMKIWRLLIFVLIYLQEKKTEEVVGTWLKLSG